MKSIVIDDSLHGNAKRIAGSMAAGIGGRPVRFDAADVGVWARKIRKPQRPGRIASRAMLC